MLILVAGCGCALLIGAVGGFYWAKRRPHTEALGSIPEVYIQGLNHLLGERNDEAVKVFLASLRQHPESLDILLALGRLFRRRGELERALTVHQYLLDQQDLSVVHRREVLLEMARDYLKAGILNRAESILRDVLERDSDALDALLTLAELYELGADWEPAIRTRQQLRDRGVAGQSQIIALLWGELAELAWRAGDGHQAAVCLEAARREDPDCPRIAVIEGLQARDRQDWAGAARAWSRLLHGSLAGTLTLVLEPFLEALGQCQALADCRVWRQSLVQLTSRDGTLSRLVNALERSEGREAARLFLQDLLHERPDLSLLQWYLRLGGEVAAVQADVQETVLRLPLVSPALQCAHCGYQAAEFYWRCPSCRDWGTFVRGGDVS